MSTPLTPAERQRRRVQHLTEQGYVRVSVWLPAATADALECLARDARVTQRLMLTRLIEGAARDQRVLARMKAVTRLSVGCQRG